MRLEQLENPKRVDLSKRQLDAAVDLVRRAIDEGATPGAVVLIARRGHIVVEEALGKMSYDEDAEPVRRDTMYDLASLTKVIVTTTLSMILHERELLDLDSPVRDYLPEFDGGDKQIVLVKDLLAHSGGLLWWTDLYKKFEGQPLEDAKRGYLQTIYEMPLDYTPRSKTVYSDLGIFLMGEILERITGKALDVLAKEEIFEPLEMDETMFRPPESLRSRIAPTERDEWRGRVVHGEVHDENAYGFGGVAPHAGLFSTARSLAPFVQMLLNGGAYDGRRLINGATIELFTTRAGLVADSSRALGWDTPSGRSSSGKFFSASSFGHTGFTGVSIWIDPERELFTILLTNRVHPTRENRKLYDVRAGFHDAVIEAITDIEVLPRVEE
jgi:CubicO group peptidase (beta-lactamase class C family)